MLIEVADHHLVIDKLLIAWRYGEAAAILLDEDAMDDLPRSAIDEIIDVSEAA